MMDKVRVVERAAVPDSACDPQREQGTADLFGAAPTNGEKFDSLQPGGLALLGHAFNMQVLIELRHLSDNVVDPAVLRPRTGSEACCRGGNQDPCHRPSSGSPTHPAWYANMPFSASRWQTCSQLPDGQALISRKTSYSRYA
jgi:hypothetical protein